MVDRRHFLVTGLALAVTPALAHHGWSSFDQDKPLYMVGTVKSVRWQNPHAEIVLAVAPGLTLPADLAQRPVPAQAQRVDGAALLKKTMLPPNPAGDWEIEFAPLTRMEAWGLREPLKPGDRIELVGYALADSPKKVLRVEYMFVGGRGYAFRSSPG
jgi:Family of unknown function (DUF6152)